MDRKLEEELLWKWTKKAFEEFSISGPISQLGWGIGTKDLLEIKMFKFLNGYRNELLKIRKEQDA